MAAVTLYASGSSVVTTDSTNRTVTVTTATGDLVVLVITATGLAGGFTNVLITDNDGGNYTKITNAESSKAASADPAGIWARTALVASGKSTIITVDYTTNAITHTGSSLSAYKVTGMSRAGAAAVRQAASQSNQAAAGTPAPVFGSAVLTANAVIGYVHNATNPATMTPRTSFTERLDSGYATPTTGIETMSRDSGETGTTQTWGSTSATAFSSGVIELDTLKLTNVPWRMMNTYLPFLCR